MAEISERREVAVRGDESTFVFVADPDAGRLRIEEREEDGQGTEVCGITIGDTDELSGFLEGLARVQDRDAVVERARQRNPHAFKAWTPEEEDRVRNAYEQGKPVETIAREVQRSRRAVEMRLERMGLRAPGQ